MPDTFLFTSHAMDWNLRTIELTQKKIIKIRLIVKKKKNRSYRRLVSYRVSATENKKNKKNVPPVLPSPK
jgi:hypothetical protein